MGLWFQKHRSVSPATQTQHPAPEPNTTVQQLELRLKKLEEHLASLTEKRPEIRIDTLHIHQPVLENLTFRLDQLDIKELSGSLNLGNNFGAKPDGKQGAVDAAMKKATETQGNKPSASAPASASAAASAAVNPGTGHHPGRSPSRETTEASSSTERTSTGYRYTPQPRQPGGV
ncbi:hypothetical protein [Paenibacillus sedimenti]|uniref:Uncharacterized protein n=1 Tax=Paenibacillus sedimenti TaxID=2770274 RepID=A0A926KPM3_9BACL|nr:hypothetical protein [Paenibacillus sedimenti]MBD0379820.1 hypothetical protein [Paenibacillus sedimenti]